MIPFSPFISSLLRALLGCFCYSALRSARRDGVVLAYTQLVTIKLILRMWKVRVLCLISEIPGPRVYRRPAPLNNFSCVLVTGTHHIAKWCHADYCDTNASLS